MKKPEQQRRWVCKCGNKNIGLRCKCGLQIELQGNGWRYTNLDMRTGRAMPSPKPQPKR